jgi:cation diffusion facilitator family transporter
MIALLIGYEAVTRFLQPVPIRFAEAIPIAGVGLVVNIASVLLLMGGHDHHHGHSHGHGASEPDDAHRFATRWGTLVLDVFEDGVPPRFRLRAETGTVPPASSVTIDTARPGGAGQSFIMLNRGGYLESAETIPEPHEFVAHARIDGEDHPLRFEEHDHTPGTAHPDAHGSAHRDNNMRAAFIHVMADAAVSVLVILGLLLARAFGWLWMDPLAGIIGACVIASWSRGLIRDTGAILLDMNPDHGLADRVRQAIESDGDALSDLHLWRLGPGHLGAIVSVSTAEPRGPDYYRARLARFRGLSHLTIEVDRV